MAWALLAPSARAARGLRLWMTGRGWFSRMAPAHDRRVAETVITPYRDGPLLVRGPVRVQDQDGREIVIRREVVALCRCGKSRTRPLCDGTHKLVHFRAPSGLEDGTRNGAALNGSARAAASNGASPNG
jgi:CDGSH-type Zn-finger protein